MMMISVNKCVKMYSTLRDAEKQEVFLQYVGNVAISQDLKF